MTPGELVMSGGLWLALPIALAAGVLSFLSPCVLPLVPGYLGYVSGVAGGAQASRRRTIAGVVLFVAGFSAVFLTVFLLAGTVGRFVLQYRDVLLRVGGVLCILLGLIFIGLVTVAQRSWKLPFPATPGLVGAPLLGIVFAVGWTPCISPTLIAVSALAGIGGDPARALLIGAVYCIGLGLPFLLIAIGFGWVARSVGWARKHIRAINIAGGVLLIVVGLLMVTGVWSWLMASIGAVIGGFVNPL